MKRFTIATILFALTASSSQGAPGKYLSSNGFTVETKLSAKSMDCNTDLEEAHAVGMIEKYGDLLRTFYKKVNGDKAHANTVQVSLECHLDMDDPTLSGVELTYRSGKVQFFSEFETVLDQTIGVTVSKVPGIDVEMETTEVTSVLTTAAK